MNKPPNPVSKRKLKRKAKRLAKLAKSPSPKPAPRQRSEYAKRSAAFLDSQEWKRLRYAVLKERGAKCECCGATPADGAVMHVDHIKPRYKFPELALVKSNLQILCTSCNYGKGAWDDTDWRAEYRLAMDRDGPDDAVRH